MGALRALIPQAHMDHKDTASVAIPGSSDIKTPHMSRSLCNNPSSKVYQCSEGLAHKATVLKASPDPVPETSKTEGLELRRWHQWMPQVNGDNTLLKATPGLMRRR
mmetsp:Transcript_44305/g.104886  ORF Transcript_44305/g.104886 Transcript_44305/m.104886 type:complete len:106 (+) Transcript_44305:1007-1324(+)